MILRRRQVLVSDEMWSRICEAAAAESRDRGEPVSAEDWILDELNVDAAMYFVAWHGMPTVGDMN